MSTTLTISKEHIAKTPGVCGGKACIAGTRIRVMDIVAHAARGNRSPEELTTFFTTPITIADVHAALAYYYDNVDEIEALFEMDRLTSEYGMTQPSKLHEALEKYPELRENYMKLIPDEK